MLALHGYDAFGLEVSQKAVETATTFAEAELANPSECNFSNRFTRLKDDKVGTVKFVQGDFFHRSWESQCESGSTQGFDLIYDYTVCYIFL